MNPQTFFEHFERLTDAPHAVARLRELILQLAVQGRLVAQDERDEPATHLLERIAAERTRLVRAKKIREAKPLPPVSDDEKPFEIPDSWQWVRLGDIGISQTGTTPAKSDVECFGNDFPFIKPADIRPNGVDYYNEGLSKKGVEKYGRLAAAGSVLMVCIGTIGKANVIERDCSFNQQINSLTPLANTNSYLINYFLRSDYFQEAAWAKANRTTIAILNKGNWENIRFPLPPLEEQKRIVAKVDELMRLCDELERVQAERREARQRLNRAALDGLLAARDAAESQSRWQTVADHFPILTATPDQIGKLRQTVLQLAVQGRLTRQDPQDEPAPALLRRIRAEKERLAKEKKSRQLELLPPIADDETPSLKLPGGWAWARLGELARFIDYRGNTPPKTQSGVKLITAKNVRMGYINEYPQEYISEETYQQWMTRGFPKCGDVLFTTEAPLGNVAQLLTNEKVGLAQRVIDLQPFQPLFPEYLKVCLMSQFMQDAIRAKATGITATGIKAAKLKLILAPVPPLEEQKRIVAAVSRLMALCDEVEAGLRRAEEDGERLLRAAVRSLLDPAPENSTREPALA